MRPCPEMGRGSQGVLAKERALGQIAGLMGRWPMEQQAGDGQSSEWHPQTARIGAFSKTESGLPWRRQDGGRRSNTGWREEGQTRVPRATALGYARTGGAHTGCPASDSRAGGHDRSLVNGVCSAGWELSVPAPPAHLLSYRSGLYKGAQLCPSPWFQL